MKMTLIAVPDILVWNSLRTPRVANVVEEAVKDFRERLIAKGWRSIDGKFEFQIDTS